MTASVPQRLLRKYRFLRGIAYVFRWSRGRLTAGARRIQIAAENARYLGRSAPDGLPIPPPGLIYLVAGSRSISWFLHHGQLGAESIRGTLSNNGIDIEELPAILDFGCGCGRVIRHWQNLAPRTAVHGVDYNPTLIQWCRQKLDFAHFEQNNASPPLDFESETFDLIYALSVFTHLSEDLHFGWIKELSRVVKPNGYLLISTRTSIDPRKLKDVERENFLAGKLIVRSPESSGSNISNAFHPETFVREQLAVDLEVVDYVVEGAKGNPPQDLFLLRKPAV